MSPSQIVHRLGGSKRLDTCEELPEFHCWVCGHAATRGTLRHKWQGSNFTGQNKVRAPESAHVCESCVVVMSGRPPNTERFYTHLVEGDSHVRVNKAGKPEIREFLRRPKAETWFASIADSGQKHIIPWTPINSGGQPGGRVLFEEALVDLPRDEAGWSLIDEMADMLTAGATKAEMERGEYGPRAWQLCGAELRAFEERHGWLRGGAWFGLALWLAQRDEAAVQARMEAEKAARAAKKKESKGGRKAQRGTAKPDRRGAARNPKPVSRDARMQRAEALGPTDGPDARGGADKRNARGVANDNAADATTRSSTGDQLALFS